MQLLHRFRNVSVPELTAAVGVTGQSEGLCDVVKLCLPARYGFIWTAAGRGGVMRGVVQTRLDITLHSIGTKKRYNTNVYLKKERNKPS